MALTHEPDVAAGQWLADRLGPLGARVGSLVPSGYEAYARVLHPAEAEDGSPARWADVAAACGTTLHPTAQFWRLVGAPEGWRPNDGTWPGRAPRIGTLDAAAYGAVIGALATAVGPDVEVVAGLWEGFGWIDGAGVSFLWLPDDDATAEELEARQQGRSLRGAFDRDVLAAPRLELPHRSYLLFRGTLAEVATVLDAHGPWSTPGVGSWDQSPNLLWPADRSWCLATEIDLDSTVIGGPAPLIEAVLARPDLEALPLPADASLMADGDTVN